MLTSSSSFLHGASQLYKKAQSANAAEKDKVSVKKRPSPADARPDRPADPPPPTAPRTRASNAATSELDAMDLQVSFFGRASALARLAARCACWPQNSAD